jgi:hypothetical protein
MNRRASEIDSHLALGGIIAIIELSTADWDHLCNKGYVPALHPRDSSDGESVIELTIKAPNQA